MRRVNNKLWKHRSTIGLHNMAFGADFEPDTGNCGYSSIRINCHYIELGEAAQKIVSHNYWNRI